MSDMVGSPGTQATWPMALLLMATGTGLLEGQKH